MGITYSCCMLQRSPSTIGKASVTNEFIVKETSIKDTSNSSTMVVNRGNSKSKQSGNTLFSIRVIQTNFKTKTNAKSQHLKHLNESNQSLYVRYNTHIDKPKDYKEHVEQRLCSFSKRTGLIHIKSTDNNNNNNNNMTDISQRDDNILMHKEIDIAMQRNEMEQGMVYTEHNNNNESEMTKSDHYLNFMKNDGSPYGSKKLFKKSKTKKAYKIVSESLSDIQTQYLKKILRDEEMIIKEMDEKTIQLILRSISYIRVKAECILFYYKNEVSHSGVFSSTSDIDCCFQENNFYIIEKGKVEMIIDNVKYHIEKDGSISTKAMIKNTKDECKLTTIKRVYLYKLPIEKYISIFNDFVDNLIEEKVKIFKRVIFKISLNLLYKFYII